MSLLCHISTSPEKFLHPPLSTLDRRHGTACMAIGVGIRGRLVMQVPRSGLLLVQRAIAELLSANWRTGNAASS